MNVKLKDVATAAGVSVSTVSRVINGDRERPASKETVDKIWAIVKELGYVPNKSAKCLVKGDNETADSIGRICCIYTSAFDLNNDPFFSCIGIGIQRELNQQKYSMAYTISATQMDYEALYSYVNKHPADGVIVLGTFDIDILEMLQKHYKHLVYAGVDGVDPRFDQVICDGYDGAKMAIKHLIEMGHKKIGYVGYIKDETDETKAVDEPRYRAYRDIMNDESLKITSGQLIHSNHRTTEAYNKMAEYIDKTTKEDMPSAFYCANDATGFGVLKALQVNGYKVPEDVALIGFDNVEMTSFVTPTLSTIRIPQRALGSQAVKMLIEQIENKRDYPLKVSLPFDLIVRESSQKNIDV